MKKLYSLFCFLFFFVSCLLPTADCFSQSPNKINYQAVARDGAGNPMATQTVTVIFRVHEGTAGGAVRYRGTQNYTTNQFGLFSATIGQTASDSGSFSTLAWGSNNYFLQVFVNSFDMGTTQFLSVPYSLHSKTADSLTGGIGAKPWVKSGGKVFLNMLSDSVGIGTASPAFKLDVFGSMNIRLDSSYRIGGDRVLRTIASMENLYVGPRAGISDVNGFKNVYVGYSAGELNTDGYENTFMGYYTGYKNTLGRWNTFIGAMSGYNTSTGQENVFLGTYAGQSNTAGNKNTFVGDDAGLTNTSGSKNTYIGVNAGGSATITNATAIGNNASVSISNALVLGGTGIDAVNVGIGTTSPNTSSLLDITSTAKGVLIPRMTGAQMTSIATPANGLMVYNTDSVAFCYYNGTAWRKIYSPGSMPASLWSRTAPNTFLTNNGDSVGIGVSSPTQAKVEIRKTGGATDAMFVSTNGTGRAMTIQSTNTGSGSAALKVSTSGSAPAGYFEIQTAGSNAIGVHGYTSGTGSAGLFQINNSSSSAHTLRATNIGSGSAIFASIASPGTGRAGYFENTNAANASDALYSTTNGAANSKAVYGKHTGTGVVYGVFGEATGSGGSVGVYGYASNASGTNNYGVAGFNQSASSGYGILGQGFYGVYGQTTSSSGYGVYGIANNSGSTAVAGFSNTGSGRAGHFEITGAGNASSALYVKTIGTGLAGEFVGKVQINDGSAAANKILVSTDALGTAQWQTPSAAVFGGWSLTGNALTGSEWLGSSTAQPLVFRTSSTERMRIDASGNVGIGITPSYKLHVSANTANSRIMFEGNGGSGNPTIYIKANAGAGHAAFIADRADAGGLAQIEFRNTGVTQWTIGTPDNGVYDPTSLAFSIGYNNPKMTILQNGNVGIGTSAPGNHLHINNSGNNASALIESSVNDKGGTWAFSSRSLAGTVYTGRIGIEPGSNQFTASGGTAGDMFVANISAGGGPIHILPTNTPGTGLMVSAAGNVGIGTTTPGAKLEVAGQIKITGGAPANGAVLTSDASGLAIWQSPPLAGFPGGGMPGGSPGQTLRYGATQWVAESNLYNDGTNVSIGTGASGTAKLDVLGDVKMTGSGSNHPLTVKAQADGYGVKILESDGGNDAIGLFGYSTRGRMYFMNNGTITTDIDASGDTYFNGGNVGIGTASPTGSLHIRTLGTASQLYIERAGASQSNGISFKNEVGTTAGQVRLNGVSDDDLQILTLNGVSNDIRFYTNSDGANGAPSNERMVILAAGNVGIGTASPNSTATLHVELGTSTTNGMLVTGTYTTTATIPDLGAGSRMIYYPGKAAFRAGRVTGTQWNNANVGLYSFAAGNNNIASGDGSAALGDGNIVNPSNALAAGATNTVTANGFNGIALGSNNTVGDNSSVALGGSNMANGNTAFSAGFSNSSGGSQAVTIGRYNTANGIATVAMGNRTHDNSFPGNFLFGDNSTTSNLISTAANQFNVRAAGGIRMFTNPAMSIGVQVAAGGNSWAAISDSTKKENLIETNGEYILNSISKMKIGSWNYKTQDPKQFRHYGPMAQDFYAYFGNDGIGIIGNDTTIASADFDGINMIAIKALEKRTAALNASYNLLNNTKAEKAELEKLKSENEKLKLQIEKMRTENIGMKADVEKIKLQLGIEAETKK